MTHTPILLFDLDGVLIHPLGYRAALRASVNHFRTQWGWQPDPLPEEEIALFEAHGITSEWDMLPLILASQLEQTALEGARLPQGFPTGADGNLPAPKQRAALRERLGALQTNLQPGEHPAQAALRLNLYPHLPRPLQNALFNNTRRVEDSHTTRVFQHFALGDGGYTQTYGRAAEFQSPPLLREKDQPLLSAAWRTHLQAQRAAQRLYYAALTARPSLPPRGTIAPFGFPPEAEFALACIGIPEMPLIGYGRLQHLAQVVGGEAEQFLKPSPVQALAAILAALGEPEERALLDALAVAREKRLNHRLAALEACKIAIFEDSPGGIRAGLQATAHLRDLGVAAHFKGYGITANPDKQRVLENLGARVFLSINEALRDALD
ncbi:MAG: hypothetical protein OHK0052_14530 [Anaerolineales bacterium]